MLVVYYLASSSFHPNQGFWGHIAEERVIWMYTSHMSWSLSIRHMTSGEQTRDGLFKAVVRRPCSGLPEHPTWLWAWRSRQLQEQNKTS